jgi:hypothetical protein
MRAPAILAAVAVSFLVGALSHAEPPAAPPPVSEANWHDHPRVVEVRELVAAVDDDLQKKRLTGKSKDTPCAGLMSTVTVHSDTSGKVRRLVASAGSGDSSYTLTATYDTQGVVRFVLIQAGAVSDSTLEQRFWFDADAARLWSREDARGPGWTWWRPTKKTWELLKRPSEAMRLGACELLS